MPIAQSEVLVSSSSTLNNPLSERGHPRLRQRHLRFSIGLAERDAWMTCMRRALDEVVADPALRASLELAFFRLADFMRNRTEHGGRGEPAPGTP